MFKAHLLKVIGSVIFLFAVWMLWLFIRPVEIIRANDTSVYVKNLPSGTESKIVWWNKNQNSIQQKYHVIKDPHNLDVFLMNFGGYKEPPRGSWNNNIDDYHCFDDIKDKKNCILNDIAMVIRGDADKNIYFTSGGKTYIQTPDGKVTVKKDNSAVY